MGLFSGIGGLFEGSQQGQYYNPQVLNNQGTQSLADMLNASRSQQVTQAGQQLAGGKSLNDVMGGLNADQQAGLASSPVYAQMVAQQQVQQDPLLSGLLGKGGIMQQTEGQEQNLANQGFKLQPQDVEAYGQASGNIARQFGQSENSLANSLASRGLAGANSGAAGAQFSGLQGNKNEQLGQMQMQIANQRMQNTMQRLGQTQQFLGQLGSLGANQENAAVGQNANANNARYNQANELSANARGDYGLQQQTAQASLESQKANQSKNLGDALAAGLYGSVSGAALGFGTSAGQTAGERVGGGNNGDGGEDTVDTPTGAGKKTGSGAGANVGQIAGLVAAAG